MIVYLTHDTTDFARELRARFLAEGHSVYTGDALAARDGLADVQVRGMKIMDRTPCSCA